MDLAKAGEPTEAELHDYEKNDSVDSLGPNEADIDLAELAKHHDLPPIIATRTNSSNGFNYF